jgi:hypothetical protein
MIYIGLFRGDAIPKESAGVSNIQLQFVTNVFILSLLFDSPENRVVVSNEFKQIEIGIGNQSLNDTIEL